MAELNPAKFIRKVRQEAKKVVWPTRKETLISTSMVLIIAMLAGFIFLLADGIIAYTIRLILGLGTGTTQ